jgi:hypothetical protein
VYKELLKKPVQESIDVNLQVRNALDQLRGRPNLRGITYHWASMDSYWKWVAQVNVRSGDVMLLVLMAPQMYGPETVDKFGSLSIVDPGLLPIGTVFLSPMQGSLTDSVNF